MEEKKNKGKKERVERRERNEWKEEKEKLLEQKNSTRLITCKKKKVNERVSCIRIREKEREREKRSWEKKSKIQCILIVR